MNKTKIPWADYTWNPLSGCRNRETGHCNVACYARKLAEGRLRGRAGYPEIAPFAPRFHPGRLNEPMQLGPGKNGRPHTIFAVSMGDPCSEGFHAEDLGQVIGVISDCHWHRFFLLTKRPHRLPLTLDLQCENLGIGTTAWDQKSFDINVLALLRAPAAMHFVSVEPMLGPIKMPIFVRLTRRVSSDLPFSALSAAPGIYLAHSNPHGALSVEVRGERLGIKPAEFEVITLNWVIAGPETGPGARPMDPAWMGELAAQCHLEGIPFFSKPDAHAGLGREFPKGWGP